MNLFCSLPSCMVTTWHRWYSSGYDVKVFYFIIIQCNSVGSVNFKTDMLLHKENIISLVFTGVKGHEVLRIQIIWVYKLDLLNPTVISMVTFLEHFFCFSRILFSCLYLPLFCTTKLCDFQFYYLQAVKSPSYKNRFILACYWLIFYHINHIIKINKNIKSLGACTVGTMFNTCQPCKRRKKLLTPLFHVVFWVNAWFYY